MKEVGRSFILPAIAGCILAAACCTAALLRAQQEAAAAEHISVVGRVLDANNQPIVGAKVTLRVFAPLKPGTIVSVVSPRPTLESPTAQTDANGRFEFTVHNRGSMQIAAEAPGYIAPDPRISSMAGRPSSSFQFPADKDTYTVDIVLLKTGTLEGILVDAESEKPITGVTVGAPLRTFARGEALFMGQVAAVAAGPDGRFLIKGLPPGDYVLRIDSEPKIWIEAQARSQDAELPEAASLGYGQLYWPAMEPVPQPWNTFKLLSGADLNLGKIRIRRLPLHTVLASAREFTCKEGDTLSVMLSRITPYSTNTIASKEIPCGDFRMSNVPEGSYRLELMRWSSEKVQVGNLQSRTALEDASEPLDVRKNGRIQLVAQRPVTLTGTVAVGNAVKDDLPDDFKKCGVFLRPVTKVPVAGEAMPASVGPKGTFEVAQLFPANTYSLTLFGFPADSYYIKQVSYNGTELADPEMVPLVAGLPAHSLQILLSPRPASFAGRIDLGTRDDASGFTVVLVRDLGDTARRLRGLIKLAADEQGRVTRTGLPAAAFYAFALPNDSLAALERPGVLDALLSAALRVNLSEGQTASVTVPLLKPPALEP